MSFLHRLAFVLSPASLALCATLAATGCAAEAAGDDAPSATESEVSSGSHRIVAAVPVGEVVDAYMKLANEAFDKAHAARPETTTLTKESLESFATGNLHTALGTFLFEKPSHEVAVADAMKEFGTFAAKAIRDAAGADGLVGNSLAEVPTGLSSFFSMAKDGLARTRLKTILKSSDGIAIDRMLDEWTRIEKFAEVDFTPYQLAGASTEANVRRALGFTNEVSTRAKGTKAVDDYAKALDEAGGRFTDDLVRMWKSSSVKAQYLFEYGEDGVGGIVLAIVDEHGQLFEYEINLEA